MAVWKTTFVSEHLKADHSQWTKCFHSLHPLPVAVVTIPANSLARANHAKSTKHIDDSHVLFQTRTHMHQHKCEDVFESALFKEKYEKKFTLDLLKIAENF